MICRNCRVLSPEDEVTVLEAGQANALMETPFQHTFRAWDHRPKLQYVPIVLPLRCGKQGVSLSSTKGEPGGPLAHDARVYLA